MSRKRKHEHVNHERWLVSYADFITLLFAFFVVLFASSQSDKKKQVQLAAAMQTAFSQMGLFEPHSRQPPLVNQAGVSLEGRPTPAKLPLPTARATPPTGRSLGEGDTGQHLQKLLTAQLAARHLPPEAVEVHWGSDGLVISLREAGFFSSGSAQIRPASLSMLHAIAANLPAASLRVEGHTDDVPIHTAQFATNWELSTARAASIARLLLERKAVLPANLSAAGYAEFHPVASNVTETGRARNRRVDIIVLAPLAPVPPSHQAP